MQLRPSSPRLSPRQTSPSGRETAPVQPTHPAYAPQRQGTIKSPVFTKKAFLLLGLAIVVLAAGYWGWQTMSSQIMPNRYQAVFLSNGQVYFGKLHGYYGSRPYMTDVYYFQANGQAASSSSANTNQLLVKLGKEIHMPEDKLVLNKDAILFVENLQDAGSVVDAIKKDSQPTSGGITR